MVQDELNSGLLAVGPTPHPRTSTGLLLSLEELEAQGNDLSQVQLENLRSQGDI